MVSSRNHRAPLLALGALFFHYVSGVESQQHPLVEWMKNKHGESFVDPRLNFFQKEDGSIVVTALEDISAHEVLLKISKSALVHDYTNRFSHCGLTEELLLSYTDKQHPMHLFAEYLKGRYSGPNAYHLFPLEWSQESLDLLETIVGNELSPSGLDSPMEMEDACGMIWEGYEEASRDALDEFWSISSPLAWKGVMIPVLDMIPIQGGGAHNVDFAMVPWWMAYGSGNSSEPVVLHATKDINAQEALYFSYSHCSICKNKPEDGPSTTPSLFHEQALVEHYPQTWVLTTGYGVDGDFLWRIEPQNQEDKQGDAALDPFQLKVTWIDELPSIYHVNVFNAHYNRLEAMATVVNETTQALLPVERKRLWEFFTAYRNAFKAAVIGARDGLQAQVDWNEHTCVRAAVVPSNNSNSENFRDTSSSTRERTLAVVAHPSSSDSFASHGSEDHVIFDPKLEAAAAIGGALPVDEKACPVLHDRYYDDLMPLQDPLDYQITSCDYHDDTRKKSTYDRTRHSHYQKIEFSHEMNLDEGTTNSCLTLVDFLQSCTAFRPHYHEYLVHYPVQFLKQLRRVLFLGGGDLMILHEIFKYSDQLDLVVGMDLDQDVVRSSFRNFGILPRMDNSKMQWWFGDAAKSLLMLPQEYYGSFDLVVVDLQNYVSDYMKVTPTMSVMDFAMAMLQPDGILSKNEDFTHRNRGNWAKYTLDLEVHSLPVTCQQSITLMSDAVDFWKVDPVDHGVATFFFKPSAKSHFTTTWGHYNKRPDKEHDKVWLDEDVSNAANKSFESLANSALYGVMIVIEAENADVSQLERSVLSARFVEALDKLDLKVVSTFLENPINEEDDNQEDDPYAMFNLMFMMKEGYVMARVWPEQEYCAFDVQLWTEFDTQNGIVEGLVGAVEGDLEESTTSYRIVTGGMAGVSLEKKIPRTTTQSSCLAPQESGSLNVHQLGEVLTHLTSVFADGEDKTSLFVVLCGDRSFPCKTLEALQSNVELVGTVEPLWSCPSLDPNQHVSELSTFICEREARSDILKITEHGKMKGIVVDSHSPRVMGQILHKIMNTTRVRDDLIEENFIIVANQLETGKSKENYLWSSAMLERFRTEMIQFNPVYHVDITVVGRDGGFSIFSTGDHNFYKRLINSMRKIQQKTGVVLEVQNAKAGIINYVPDLQPKVRVTNDDYDQEAATEQWNSQHPLGLQSFFQFQVADKISVSVGETVLYNINEEGWHALWVPCLVKQFYEDTGVYIIMSNAGHIISATRDEIHKVDKSTEELQVVLSYGDRVLVGEADSNGDHEYWVHGVVIEQVSDTVYQVQEYTNGFFYTVRRQDLIREGVADRPQAIGRALSSNVVDNVLEYILKAMDPNGSSNETEGRKSGEGYVAFGFLSDGGSVVVSWDGRTQLDVNLFATYRLSIDKELISHVVAKFVPSVKLAFYDEQPRGFGRVVNLERDLDSLWFGDLGFNE